GLERLDDALVRIGATGERQRRARLAEVRDPNEAAQLGQERMQDRHSRALRDPQVQVLVEVEELVLVALRGGAALPDQEQAELVDLVDLHHLARLPDSHALEPPAELLHLAAASARASPGGRHPP